MQQRLAKVLAHLGVASRRKAEELILEGVVHVNQALVTEVTTFVNPEIDQISVYGKPLEQKMTPKLWAYHKPKGLITTHDDPQGRPTVFDHIDVGERVISIGRLDLSTEGLLLLTNYGPWARELEKSDLKRVYKVRFFGECHERLLDRIRKPFTIDGVHYQPFEVVQTQDKWLTITIKEGKNREIRRALEWLGLSVSRLIRIAYGPYELNDLPVGYTQRVNSALTSS